MSLVLDDIFRYLSIIPIIPDPHQNKAHSCIEGIVCFSIAVYVLTGTTGQGQTCSTMTMHQCTKQGKAKHVWNKMCLTAVPGLTKMLMDGQILFR